jgi:hypothetical protein
MWSIWNDEQYRSGHSFQTTLTILVRLFDYFSELAIKLRFRIVYKIRYIQPYTEIQYVLPKCRVKFRD